MAVSCSDGLPGKNRIHSTIPMLEQFKLSANSERKSDMSCLQINDYICQVELATLLS